MKNSKCGNNDGERVEEYLAVAGLKKGQPYCAAFVSWVYQQAGFADLRSGWFPGLFRSSRLTKLALPGNLIVVYFPQLKRIGHEKIDGIVWRGIRMFMGVMMGMGFTVNAGM